MSAAASEPVATVGDPGAAAAVRGGYRALHAFFDRVVVVTLPRATERHARLARVLEGLPYELFHGVDRRELRVEDLVAGGVYDPARARRLHPHGREMPIGQIACTLSHRKVWGEVAAGRWKRVLVFEDDAVPIPAGVATIGEALAELPARWDLVYLGYDKNEEVTPGRRLKRLAYTALGAVGLHHLSAREAWATLPRPHSAHLRRAGAHDMTHAYALTPAAAERLLRFQDPVALNVDSGITRLILRRELDAYVTVPKAFAQDAGESLIWSA